MKIKTYRSFKLIRVIFLPVLLISVFIFQGQFSGTVFDDDNPTIEQPTLESYMNYLNNSNPNTPSVVTIGDYDNFDVGIDNWEQNATINPNNPQWIFFGVNASPQNARFTTNGGLNWILNNPSYHSSTCCDPWTSYTGDGTLIYASGVNGQYIYRSTNNGLNWTAPVLSVSGNDRNHVSAEYTGTGPYANYVYAGITPGNFGRSTDAGATWTTTFTPSNTLPGCYIAVGPNGDVNGGCVIYVTNTGSVDARIYNFYKSLDGGATFTLMSSQSFATVVGTANSVGRHVINNARTNPHPKIAMDNSNGPYRGRLYLIYATNNPPGSGNKPDIYLRYSTDQGATWSDTNRVNDNLNPKLSDQWFPEIYCERETGRLYIHWYDDRNNPSGYGTDIYATYTEDGGQTYKPNQRLTNVTFNYPNPPCSPNTNCYRGDYTGIAGNKEVGFSIWGDHRNGNALNMGSYFPDFAMRVSPSSDTLAGVSDSSFHYITVPSVKLYDKTARFSATVSPAPSAGTVTVTFLNKTSNVPLDSLNNYPDSLRMRIVTSGGVTSGVYTVTVKGNGNNGTPFHVRTVSITVTNTVGINSNQTALSYGLYQNFPNPFNPSTSIIYEIPKQEFVSLKIFNALGKEISSLVSQTQSAGTYSIDWNAGDHPSGIYFYILKAGNFTETRRMMLLK
ncbi:MAG: T9SS type A sorting domain-containing protein [Bacteroidetes bacterium]|nr:T9SS type A sorting domain-containing protein [Bacteroidota bacterium]